MAHVADGAHGDGWARSARLAFEKSPRRPAGRSPRPNLPYTRANKRLHLALKKHAEGERVTRPWHEAEDRGGGGNPQGDGDGLKEVEERCSPMPVTLISAAGHAALFHYCTTMLVPGKQVGWLDEDGARRRMERKGVWARMDRWTEVVDASGQTHLPLKQATRVETVCSCSNSLRGACEFERKKAIP